MKKYLIPALLSIVFISSFNLYSETELKTYTKDETQHENYHKALTDEEIKISNEYSHEGYKQRSYEELCGSKGNKEKCQGRATYLIGPSGDMILESAAKMFGVFGFMTKFSYQGPVSTVAKGPATTPPSTTGKKITEEKTSQDYCAFIPMGIEVVAMFQQQSGQQAIMATPVSEGNQQRDALLKAARSHDKRAQTATIQAGGWAATTACYVAITAKQAVSSNVMDWTKGQIAGHAIKIAASAGLTAFYWFKREKALAAKEFTKDIAKKMGQLSNCNPITETHCYCSQPETENDPKYCLPNQLKPRANAPPAVTACVDKNLKVDPNCNCLSTGCYETIFDETPLKLEQNNPVNASDSFGPVRSIFRGQLSSSLTPKWSSNILRAAHQRLSEIDPPEIPSRLTKEQKASADFFKEMGLNSNWSNYMAAKPLTAEEKKLKEELLKNEDFGSNNSQYAYSPRGSAGASSSVLRFKSGTNNQRRGDNDEKNPFELFNKLNQKNNPQQPSSKVLRFAQKAENEASIQKRDDQNIFQLIENRYQQKWIELSNGRGILND